ncbi:MAG: diacylglycerol kinase family lipid kinase [Caldilineaceae bacterium]|nr:diacylglycerol kinase family lipid kinase [Caldilineaceae bacterium]MDE0631242.1 diacylglycerol kinase family lipid kinase [Caldilineaceae bacterium]
METVKIILNPYAGRGHGGRVAAEIETAFRRGNVPFEIEETGGPGEAASLARRARLDGCAIVAAAGGDGTVHEVVNGLAEATPEDRTVEGLAVLPAGSGNDFSDVAGAPRDFDEAVHAIRVGNTRSVDLGLVEAYDGRDTLRRYFDNNLGIGFEAQVAVESRNIKRLRGFAIYLWATLRALRAYDQPFFEVNWTDGDGNRHETAKPMLLVSIGNTRRTGGAFYLTPDAVMDDGLLDLAFAGALSQLGILNLLPRAMTRTGLYGQKSVTFGRLRSASIAVQQPVPVHTDGEILSPGIEKLTVEVQPGRLQVIV